MVNLIYLLEHDKHYYIRVCIFVVQLYDQGETDLDTTGIQIYETNVKIYFSYVIRYNQVVNWMYDNFNDNPKVPVVALIIDSIFSLYLDIIYLNNATRGRTLLSAQLFCPKTKQLSENMPDSKNVH